MGSNIATFSAVHDPIAAIWPDYICTLQRTLPTCRAGGVITIRKVLGANVCVAFIALFNAVLHDVVAAIRAGNSLYNASIATIVTALQTAVVP